MLYLMILMHNTSHVCLNPWIYEKIDDHSLLYGLDMKIYFFKVIKCMISWFKTYAYEA